MSLINKSIDFARKGTPLAILSATCNENVEGYIYIEAYREPHVREAIKGLSAILGGKLSLVELAERTAIYQNAQNFGDRDRIHLERHQWVRINKGLYGGDLGLVEGHSRDDKVWIRLIPRVELNAKNQDQKFQRFAPKPLQKAFNEDEARKLLGNNPLEVKVEDDLQRKHFKYFKRQLFRKGFLYKLFSIKQLITDSIAVRPSVDEVKGFAKIIDERHSSGLQISGSGGVTQVGPTSKGSKSGAKSGNDSSGDELTGD